MAEDSTKHDAFTRRRFVTALGTTGAASAIAGCSSGSTGQDTTTTKSNDGSGDTQDTATTTTMEDVTLTLSGWAANNEESKLVQQLISDFESNNEHIKVDYAAIQSKYKQKLKTQLGAGNAPDVFYVDAKFFGAFASADVLLDLSPIEESDDFNTDDFFQPLIDAFRSDGQLQGVPKDFSTLGLFYNTAHFENAGLDPESPPTSWSGFRDALSKLLDNNDIEAPIVEYPNARVWKSFLFQNGGQVLSDDGSEAVFASDAGVEALQYLVDLKKDGLLAVPSELGAGWHGAALANQEVSTAVIGPWALPFLENNHADINKQVDVAHLPYPEDGQKATSAYTVSYSASADTNSPQGARALIKGLTSKEGMAAWAKKGLALSARKSHRDLEYYQNHPRRKTLLEAGEWSHVVGYGTNSEAILNRLHPELEGAMLGKQSPQEALETAESKINSEVL